MSPSEATGWTSTTLGSVCEINPPKPKIGSLANDTEVMFVPMAGIDDVTGTITRPEERTLGEVRGKSYRTFGPGDVLFAKITPCMENGKSAVVPDIPSGLGFGSTEFHVLRAKPGVSPRFIWHYIRQEGFRRLAEDRMTGSVGQLRVPIAFLQGSPIALPPKDLQEEIVQVLDLALASGRNAGRHLAAARRSIERFRQAILAAACSGRLTADWRDEHPAVSPADPDSARERRKMQLGRRFREPRPNPHSDITDVPKGWRIAPLGLLLREIKYGTNKRSEYGAPGIPVLRIPNVSGERLDITDLKSAVLDIGEMDALRLCLGDLLMIRSNGSVHLVGKTLPVTEEAVGMAYAGYLIRLRTDEEALNPRFLAVALASPLLRRQIEMPARSTSGVNNINTDEVRGLIVPIPPLVEQREIVHRAESMLELGDALLARIEAASQRVERSSQAVLARAFRGELGMPDGRREASHVERTLRTSAN